MPGRRRGAEGRRGRGHPLDVEVTNAEVVLASGESVFLSEQAAGWRISAVGCRPDGPPTEVPFDCELEA